VVTITVYATPPIPEVTLSNDTLSSTEAFSYQWYFNGEIIPGATDQSYVVTEEGFYYVQVTDSNGCLSNSIVMEFIMNGVLNLGDQLSFTVQSLTDNTFQIIIKGASLEKLRLNVFDVAGRMIYENEIAAEGDVYSKKIILPSSASGLYLVKLQTDHRSFVSKVMMQ
jgi:hypothetical protein